MLENCSRAALSLLLKAYDEEGITQSPRPGGFRILFASAAYD